MIDKNNIPKIRFKGFENCWDKKPLEQQLDVIDGDRGINYPNGKDLLQFGHTLFLSATNVTSDGFKFINNQYITEDKSNSMGNGKLITNDIVVTSRGSVGNVAWYNEYIQRKIPYARINSGMLILRTKNGVTPCVITHLLKSPLGQRKIDFISFGSAQPQLTKSGVSKILLILPTSKLEQKKIGEYFQQLDKLIEQKEQKYQKLKQFKKAMLSKMFPKNGVDTPEIRFCGFSGKWVEYKLDDIGSATSGTSIESEFSDNGKYKVISIGSYSSYSTYIDQGLRVNLSEKIQKRILNQNDLTMVLNDKTAAGNILGRVLLIEKSEQYVYNQRTQRIAPFQEKFDSQFLYQLFNAPLIRNKIIKKSQGNTQIYVNWSSIKELIYLTPQRAEQIKIGNYFQKLDQLIDLQQHELAKLKNLKKAFLSKMFV